MLGYLLKKIKGTPKPRLSEYPSAPANDNEDRRLLVAVGNRQRRAEYLRKAKEDTTRALIDWTQGKIK
jgi:hypothetical protein